MARKRMAIDCEITHRGAEAHACARARSMRRGQAGMGQRGIDGKRFNIISIMRSIADAVRRRSGLVLTPVPALLAPEIRVLAPPFVQREPVQMLMTPSRTHSKKISHHHAQEC